MSKIVQIPTSLIPLAELAIMAGRTPTKNEWKTWVLESQAIFRHEETIVIVPEGFMTDFASIPFLFRWWQTGGTGPQRIAAYFHDYLYSEQHKLSRKQSDQIFRLVMKAAGNDKWRHAFRRWAMYLALRVGGFLAWRSNQKSLAEKGSGWRVL